MKPPFYPQDSGFHYVSKYFRSTDLGDVAVGGVLVTNKKDTILGHVDVPAHLYHRKIWLALSANDTAPPYGFLRFYLHGAVVGEYMKSNRIDGEDVQIDWCGLRDYISPQAFRSGPGSIGVSGQRHVPNVVVPHHIGIFCDKIEYVNQGFVEAVSGVSYSIYGHLIVQSEYAPAQLGDLDGRAQFAAQKLESIEALLKKATTPPSS